MKRLGTIAIATLGLGFALSGFSNTAAAASNCPFKASLPTQVQQFQGIPYMQFAQKFGMQPQMMQQANQQQMQFPFMSMPVGNQVQAPVAQAPVAKAPVAKAPVTQAPAAQAPVAQQPANNTAAPAKQADSNVDASAYAKQITDLVNQERAKAGLKPLELDSSLSNVAQAKAADMSNNHYFDHNSPTYGSPFDMMKQYGISFMTAGENIAMGQRSPQEVMTQWMNSEGHRQNIMNSSFTKIGVGYVNGYWVQEFIG